MHKLSKVCARVEQMTDYKTKPTTTLRPLVLATNDALVRQTVGPVPNREMAPSLAHMELCHSSRSNDTSVVAGPMLDAKMDPEVRPLEGGHLSDDARVPTNDKVALQKAIQARSGRAGEPYLTVEGEPFISALNPSCSLVDRRQNAEDLASNHTPFVLRVLSV